MVILTKEVLQTVCRSAKNLEHVLNTLYGIERKRGHAFYVRAKINEFNIVGI